MDVRTIRETIAAMEFGGGFIVDRLGSGLIDWRILTDSEVKVLARHKANGFPLAVVVDKPGEPVEVDIRPMGHWEVMPHIIEREYYKMSDAPLGADLIRHVAHTRGAWVKMYALGRRGRRVGWALIHLPHKYLI